MTHRLALAAAACVLTYSSLIVADASAQQSDPPAGKSTETPLPPVEVTTAAEPAPAKKKKRPPAKQQSSAQSQAEAAKASEPAASTQASNNPNASSGGMPPLTGASTETATGPVDGIVAKRSATGSKTDTPLIETPQSVSVITADRVEQQRATTINEAVRYTAGVIPNQFGIDTRFDWLNIRGFDAYQPGFFMDGMISRNNDSWALWKVEPYGAERIEVLKGPASALYGQGKAGGMLNVISKRPLDTPLNEVELRVGNHDRFDTAFDFSGPLKADGTILYRLTGLYSDSGTQVDFTDLEEAFIAPAITWKPAEGTSITFLSQYRKDDTLPATGSYFPNPQAQIRRSLFVGEPGHDHFDREQWSVGYIVDHKINETLKLNHAARVASIDVDYNTTYSAGSPDGGITINRSTFTSDERNIAVTTDTSLEAKVRTGFVEHTILAGLDYQRNSFEQKSGFGFATAPPLNLNNPVYGVTIIDPPLYNDSDTILEQTGLYVQDQAKIADRLIVTLGGRYDWAKTDFDDHLFGGDVIKNDEAFTWRGAVLWRDPSGLSPYYSYAESFLPTRTIDPVTGKPFNPETGKQHEAGIKYEPHGFKGMFTAAVFDITRENFVTYDSNFIPSARGEVTSRGIELEATAEPMPGLDLIASYTKLFELETVSSSLPAQVGQTLPLVPLESANLWMHYRFLEGPLRGFGFGGGVRYIGESFGDDANSAAFAVPDFTLFDAVVDYELDAWRLALNVSNIEDETTFSCYDNCYLGVGRSVIGSVRYRW